jgi:hypothetical protein
MMLWRISWSGEPSVSRHRKPWWIESITPGCRITLGSLNGFPLMSRFRSSRSPHRIKSKNPDAPAVKREAEEDWDGWSCGPDCGRKVGGGVTTPAPRWLRAGEVA